MLIILFIIPIILFGGVVVYFNPITSISILVIVLIIMYNWGKSLGSSALGLIPIYLGLFIGCIIGVFINLIIKAYF